MPEPQQFDLFPIPRVRDPHPEPPKLGAWHHDWQGLFEETAESRPRSLDEIPAWLRVPGEEGHVEMDRFMRRVGKT